MTRDDGSLTELGRQLIEEPSWKGRAKAAERLGGMFCTGALSTAERALAEQFFRLTAFDEEILVRRVLAESLKRAEALSRETLLAFAADQAEVAAPLIEHSPLFEESDLLRILEIRSVAHRFALARRFRVVESICGMLLATGDEALTLTLLRNRGAAIGEEQLWRLVATPPLRPRIVEALLRRRPLPPRILAASLDLCAGFSFAAPPPQWRALGETALRGMLPSPAGGRSAAGSDGMLAHGERGRKHTLCARPKAA